MCGLDVTAVGSRDQIPPGLQKRDWAAKAAVTEVA